MNNSISAYKVEQAMSAAMAFRERGGEWCRRRM